MYGGPRPPTPPTSCRPNHTRTCTCISGCAIVQAACGFKLTHVIVALRMAITQITIVDGFRHVQLAAVNCVPGEDCFYTSVLSIASVSGSVSISAYSTF
jgi:hypothetical protein